MCKSLLILVHIAHNPHNNITFCTHANKFEIRNDDINKHRLAIGPVHINKLTITGILIAQLVRSIYEVTFVYNIIFISIS